MTGTMIWETAGRFAVLLLVAASLASAAEPQAGARRRFLAVDTLEGKQGLHYVDQENPANDWSLKGTWRDIQLVGDHRVALSDLSGLSLVDLKARKVVAVVRPKGLANVLSFRFQPDGLIVFNMTNRGLTVADPLGLTQRDLAKTNANGLVRPTGDGGWTLTVMGDKGSYFAAEFAADGAERARVLVPGSRPVYKTCRLANGNYLLTAGYGGFAAEIKSDGEIVRRFTTEKKFFYSGFQVLPNGNLVVANWTGHNEAERRKPNQGDQIIEFSPEGKVVWSYRDLERLGCIHGVIMLDGIDPGLPHEQLHGKLVPVPAAGAPKVQAAIAAPANSLDGLALLPDGAVALSVPNLADRKPPPAIIRIAPDGTSKPPACFEPGPGSERAVPFGMDAAPDGTLYIADNQFFSESTPRPPSRLLALAPDGKARVVATGLRVANGVRVHGGHVYVTESQVRVADKTLTSALLRFPLKGETVNLEADLLKNQHLVASFETPIVRDPFGADGIVFDADGRALVSFFDSGAVERLALDAGGKVRKQDVLIPPGLLPSADGLALDGKSGALFIADPRGNSIHMLAPNGLRTLARAGLLDMPVDVIVRDGKVIVSNWTSPKCPCRLVSLEIPPRQ